MRYLWSVAPPPDGDGKFAESIAGPSVDLSSVSDPFRQELAAELETPVEVVVGDVTDTQTARDAVVAGEALGGLWGLVNNAGINSQYRPVSETPLAEWDQVLATNLLGAAAFARAVGRYLTEAGEGGRIVNLGSIGGLVGLPNIGPYNASKAALDALTRTLAVELGPAGILCNSVAPGTIVTDMVDALISANPALEQKWLSKSPIGRLGSVDDAVWPIVFLLTDAAAFITGQTLVVDGGRLTAA
jgi:NAD(P)-dependent dehydrogenase (short-subunit alcohol dehydrogenase family)